jgi:hypothetical protein
MNARATARLLRPDPLALHGLAGDFVRMVGPHSEADAAGLLVQFLTAFGNAVGSGPWFRVEADRHAGNLFALLIGRSSSGRKGTSWGQVRRVFDLADPEWVGRRVQPGLTSGEGLIWHVRDPESESSNGRSEPDAGIQDKRLLALETEFASILRVLGREGNTLSPTLRCAWDSGHLCTLSKNSPAKATGAHVSIIAHTTRDELLRELDEVQMANGFANRFLPIFVVRSKVLPEGGFLVPEDLAALAERVRRALESARGVGEIKRDEPARALWRKVYPFLTHERPGMLGAITARGAAHVVRLSLIYAILDGAREITVEHLRAALAVWDYAFASAHHVFGDALGNSAADTILSALRSAPDGLTKTEIHDLFHRHRGPDVDRALRMLEESGLAERRTRATTGRTAEVWYAKEAKEAPSIASFASSASSEAAESGCEVL